MVAVLEFIFSCALVAPRGADEGACDIAQALRLADRGEWGVNSGSILSQGAHMSAEGNAVLLTTKDIVFDVADNTERSDSSSRGKGWGFTNNTSACRSAPTTPRARAAAAATPSPAPSCRLAAACAWPPPRAISA